MRGCSWPLAERLVNCPSAGENIIYFRNLEDYRRLREMCGQNQHFV